MPDDPGPMARRRQLGSALRTYRIEARLSVREVADRLLCSPAKISRIETAQRNISLRDVRDLCDLYRLTDEFRDQLMALARESRETAWWHSFDLDPALEKYVGLEISAAKIKDYQIGGVPGLLQTREYATAILSAWIKDDPVTLAKTVDVRMMRQAAVAKRIDLHAVMDESVVRRVIGGPEIMRAQLDRLIRECGDPHVRLQVVPFGAGSHKGMISGFVALHFARSTVGEAVPAMSDVVYCESITDEALFFEKSEDVDEYLMAFDEIAAAAMSERETLAFLKSIHRDI